MATAIRGRGAAYDIRPTSEGSGFGPLGGLTGFFKDAVQGACAGLLAFLGSLHMTDAPQLFAPLQSEIDVLDRVWQSFSAGGLAGPAELIGGLALFMAARRPMARTLGLLGFVAFAALYANGVTVPEMQTTLSASLAAAANAVAPQPAP